MAPAASGVYTCRPMSHARSARDNPAVFKVLGIVGNRCPRCIEGRVWTGILRMEEHCRVCRLQFAREEGYFSGAMAISYALGGVLAFPLFFALALMRLPIWQVLAGPILVLVLCSPLLVRFSRLILMHTDPSPFEGDR
jgi:uncharacterized protein (DUF983 family)